MNVAHSVFTQTNQVIAQFVRTHEMLSGKKLNAEFLFRLQQHLPMLLQQLDAIYFNHAGFDDFVQALLATVYTSYMDRSDALKLLDKDRARDPLWFQSQNMVGGVCYVDLYADNLAGVRAQIPYFKSLGLTYLHLMPLFKAPDNNNDGGYAVSNYREVNPQLGNMTDLNVLAEELRAAGISLVLDFIFNHTSNEHAWAKKCLAGESHYQDFYLIYPDRNMPDKFEKTVREIFPEEHAGAFTQLADKRWVWTTFHSYQWDLNYANPDVFLAMAAEMLFIANQGAEVLRMDAVAFLWKQLGTNCENLPQVHILIRAFNSVAKIAAPSLLFKSEAIVHPDEVIRYISSDECQISYNPLQMALLWSTLATREVNLLHQALTHRNAIDPHCSWVNYVRSHDDIGWTFSDEDAAHFSINGFMHREFLNRFYVNRFPGSFARGVPFQENLKNGDCRICGTTASLTGWEQGDEFAIKRILILYNLVMTTGGIPLIYLGDEVGLLNDESYLQDPAKATDSRWVHRVKRAPFLYDEAMRIGTSSRAAELFQGLRHLIKLRKKMLALAGGKLITLQTNNPSVLAYLRDHAGHRVYIVANFSERNQSIQLEQGAYLRDEMWDVIARKNCFPKNSMTLEPYQFLWLE